MSLMYCDYCNRQPVPANQWDGLITPEGESVCYQCEFDGVLED